VLLTYRDIVGFTPRFFRNIDQEIFNRTPQIEAFRYIFALSMHLRSFFIKAIFVIVIVKQVDFAKKKN